MQNSRYQNKLGRQQLVIASFLAIAALMLFGCATSAQAAEQQQDLLDQLIATVLGQEPNFDEYDLADASTLEVHTIDRGYTNTIVIKGADPQAACEGAIDGGFGLLVNTNIHVLQH